VGDTGSPFARVTVPASAAGVSAIAHVGIFLRDAVDEQLDWFAFISADEVLSVSAECFLFDFHCLLLCFLTML